MSNLIKLSVFLVILSLCSAKLKCATKTCNENETYTDCGSGCGDLTCENPSYANMMCPAVCIEGCFCNQGFVRHNGKCILAEECEVKCPAHQHFSECGANACQSTCENPTLNMVCRGICMEGCVCDEGYLRSSDGSCVRNSDCSYTVDY